MTEYVITEIGRHQWLVFADRQSIAFCASENEAVMVMTEHSACSGRSRGSSSAAIWFGCKAETPFIGVPPGRPIATIVCRS